MADQQQAVRVYECTLSTTFFIKAPDHEAAGIIASQTKMCLGVPGEGLRVVAPTSVHRSVRKVDSEQHPSEAGTA